MGTYSLHPIECISDTQLQGSRGSGTTHLPPVPHVSALWLGSTDPHHHYENWFSAVKSKAGEPSGSGGVPENPPGSSGSFHLLSAFCPLVLCKRLLTHIFVSTIAFLTVNFRFSNQDNSICERTEIFIVVFCLAQCLPSSICLCDTLGEPRAVGCPSAVCLRLGNAQQRDLLPSRAATFRQQTLKLSSSGVP